MKNLNACVRALKAFDLALARLEVENRAALAREGDGRSIAQLLEQQQDGKRFAVLYGFSQWVIWRRNKLVPPPDPVPPEPPLRERETRRSGAERE